MAYITEYKAAAAKRQAKTMEAKSFSSVPEVLGIIKHAAKAGMSDVFIQIPAKKLNKLRSVLVQQGYVVEVDLENKTTVLINVEWV